MKNVKIYVHIDKDFRLIDKRQTRPLVREGARIRQDRKCQTVQLRGRSDNLVQAAHRASYHRERMLGRHTLLTSGPFQGQHKYSCDEHYSEYGKSHTTIDQIILNKGPWKYSLIVIEMYSVTIRPSYYMYSDLCCFYYT
jgi:hypothetical protein